MDSVLHGVIKLEGSKNWNIWRFQTTVLLRGQGLFDIVNGTTIKPENGADRTRWETQDAKAQTLLVTRMSEDVMIHILSCETSAEIWRKLLSVYEQKSETSIHIVQQRFFQYKYEKGAEMSTFLSKIQEMQNQLKQLGETISDKFVITKVLMSLPDQYKHFVSAWESAPDDKQTYDNLVARLLIEEERIKEKSGGESAQSSSSTAFVAKKNFNKKLVKCYKCNKQGHFQSECRFNQSASSNNYYRHNNNNKDSRFEQRCFYCNKVGHIKSQCRFKKQKGENNAFIVESAIGNFHKTQWLVDSGASEHMCCDYKLFSSYSSVTNKVVTVGNGTQISVEGCGQVALEVWNGNKWIHTTIDNVLHVPELKMNLLSVNRVTSRGYVLITNQNNCKFYNKNNEIVAIAQRSGNMYVLDCRFYTDCLVNAAKVTHGDMNSWHERLAHQNIHYVKDILKKNNVSFHELDSKKCESCLKGKIHRLPYPVSDNVSTRTCEIIHADTCGPMEETSVGGSKYFVVFKDDYSKYRIVYFVKNKEEIKKCIRNFVARVENETGNTIKIFRSDNGTEFINKEVQDMFQAKGIIHQTSIPYTPEQNGNAERENRTLVEAARTMLCAKNLPKKLWAEAINTAAYVINRTGKSSVPTKTPYELWSNKTYDINNLKIFGTTVFVHIPKVQRKKWDPKGEKGFLMGYGETTKGYRVYFPCRNSVETRRDIVFIENNQSDAGKFDSNLYNFLPEKLPASEASETQEQSVETCLNSPQDSYQENSGTDSDGSLYEPSESEKSSEQSDNGITNRQQSKRVRKRPAFYECHNALVTDSEPKTFEEAMSRPDSCKWKEAIQKELQTLKENNTWNICELPDNTKVISSKWVFKIKNNNNNRQYKARLVARGFEQNDVLDLNNIYAPVAKLSTFRLFLAVATKLNLPVSQMDVTGAFLYGDIEEDVYLKLPEGAYNNGENIVKLNRSLYGLKKSPKYWNVKFNSVMIREGFKRSQCDSCLYTKCNDKQLMYVIIYVDDLLVFGTDTSQISEFKLMLSREFKIKDLGLISDFLGINVKQNLNNGVTELCQKAYLENVLKRFNMYNCKPISTPMDRNFNTKILESECKSDKNTENLCRQIIGCLMYAVSGTRPDLCVAVSILSRFQDSANNTLLVALKRVLRYIKHTINYKLVYKCDDGKLLGFCDADWGGDLRDRKSTTGYCFIFSNCLISWCSKRQSTVSISSTEAEYVAMSMASSEACWLINLLNDFNIPNVSPVTILCDNQSAIMVANTNTVKRLKHIDIKYHYIRELILLGKINVKYVSTTEQVADMYTKPLNREMLLKFIEKCGIM